MVLVVSYIFWGYVTVILPLCAASPMQAQGFSEIDQQITAVLDDPKDQLDWDNMMNNIATVTREIKNMIEIMKENNQEVVQQAYEVYQLGKPKFIDHSISEPDIEEAAKVTSAQFLRFHELRDDIDNLWNDFLDILGDKTGQTLDYGVHGKVAGYGEGEPGYLDGGGVGYGLDIGPGYAGPGDYGANEDTGYGGGYGGGGGYRGGYGGRFGGGYGGRGGRGRRGGGGYRGGGGFGPPY